MANNLSILDEITIQGLGVIDSATLEIGPGLTVLTGETGAGKTMVLTALSLILGGKADADFVRHGCERSTVSGRFQIFSPLAAELNDDGINTDDGDLVIARTLTSTGKSKLRLGGMQATSMQVSQLATKLVEIHAQSSTARLSKPQVQLELLDSFASHPDLITAYQKLFHNYQELAKRIKELRSRIEKRDSEIAELQSFLDDFNKVAPKDGELLAIDSEIVKLNSVELLHAEISHALTLLDDEEISVFNLLQQIRRSLDLTRGKDSALDEIGDRFLDQLFSLQEVFGDLSSYVMNLEADPARFEKLQQRKASINSLLKKFGKGSDKEVAYLQLINEGKDAQGKLNDLLGGDDRLLEMENEGRVLFMELHNKAVELSQSRRIASEIFATKVSAELTALSMPHATLLLELERAPGAEISDYSPSGLDEIKILFSAHKSGVALPLSKVASGGEMSRVMLAIEVVLAADSGIGTYIFDEVDSGVGGKAALEVGRRLSQLSKSAQVIVVTHLAQVAAWADHHWVVRKSESGSVTQSDVIRVSAGERESEIARMLSGQEESQLAREHAAELLKVVRDSMIS